MIETSLEDAKISQLIIKNSKLIN